MHGRRGRALKCQRNRASKWRKRAETHRNTLFSLGLLNVIKIQLQVKVGICVHVCVCVCVVAYNTFAIT